MNPLIQFCSIIAKVQEDVDTGVDPGTGTSTGGGTTTPPPSGGGGGTPTPTNAASIDAREVYKYSDSSGAATAQYILGSDGKVRDGDTLILENWLDAGSVSAFECRATIVSGAVSSGTLNTWQALSSDRSWTRNATAGQLISCQIKIEIREASSQTILDSATITLTAEKEAAGGGGGGGGIQQ